MDCGERDIIPNEEEIDDIEEGGDAHTRGKWEGSNVTPAEITWLYQSKRIPQEVSHRLMADEIEPKAEPDEVVVFVAHFTHGLGLPAINFLRGFLDRYKL
jgi:hypothetical protein